MARKKTTALFAIDVIIALALLIAGGSAIAFLIPYSAIEFATSSSVPTFGGIDYGAWRTLHMCSGIVMTLGGAIHLALHWSWMVRSTKNLLGGGRAD